jgi:hypothetical protein
VSCRHGRVPAQLTRKHGVLVPAQGREKQINSDAKIKEFIKKEPNDIHTNKKHLGRRASWPRPTAAPLAGLVVACPHQGRQRLPAARPLPTAATRAHLLAAPTAAPAPGCSPQRRWRPPNGGAPGTGETKAEPHAREGWLRAATAGLGTPGR